MSTVVGCVCAGVKQGMNFVVMLSVGLGPKTGKGCMDTWLGLCPRPLDTWVLRIGDFFVDTEFCDVFVDT